MYHIIYNLESMFSNLDDCEQWLRDLVLTPRIPAHRTQGEDKTTPRICVGKTIEDCITGIGVFDVFRRCCKWYGGVDCGPGNENDTEAYPIAIIELPNNLHYYKPNKQEVPDAYFSEEYWLLEPAAPIKAQIYWLNAYSLEFFWIDDLYEECVCDRVRFLEDLTSYDHPWLNGKGHTLNGANNPEKVPAAHLSPSIRQNPKIIPGPPLSDSL